MPAQIVLPLTGEGNVIFKVSSIQEVLPDPENDRHCLVDTGRRTLPSGIEMPRFSVDFQAKELDFWLATVRRVEQQDPDQVRNIVLRLTPPDTMEYWYESDTSRVIENGNPDFPPAADPQG